MKPTPTPSKLLSRFSKTQAELAEKISNDIAEDIDCGESRAALRMAVAYFADAACVESQRRAAAEDREHLNALRIGSKL